MATLYVSSTCQKKVEELNIKEFTNYVATLFQIDHHLHEQNMPVKS
jgi:hypothetical protein